MDMVDMDPFRIGSFRESVCGFVWASGWGLVPGVRERMRWILAFATVFFSLVSPPRQSLHAQEQGQEQRIVHELGVFVSRASSAHPELPDPAGFGASAHWEVNRFLLARLSFHRLEDDTSKPGTVCRVYSQRIDCRTEMTSTEVTLSGLRGALLGALPVGGWLRLAMGGGLSFNHIDAESVGESGMKADLLSANAGQIGILALLNAAIRPLEGAPLSLTGGVGMHWVDFNACSGEDPPPVRSVLWVYIVQGVGVRPDLHLLTQPVPAPYRR